MTRVFTLIILVFTGIHAKAQYLTLINNTGCKLKFTVFGSLQTPCGEECSFNGTVNSSQQIVWKKPSEARWDKTGETIYWRAFALRYDNAPVIGNCNEKPPFSGVIPIPGCKDVEYSWNVDEEGNIVVTLSAVSIPKNITKWQIRPEAGEGGVNVVITPMLEVSSFIDVSENEPWLAQNSFRVRTNQKFIVSARPKQREANAARVTLAVDKNALYNNYNVCSSLPISGNSRVVTINCFSGTDQKFNVLYSDTSAKPQLLFTATEP